MDVYERIAELCRERGIAVTALEQELGFSRGSIGKMRYAKRPNAERIKKIAEYFEVSLDELMEENPEKKKKNIIRVYHSLTPRQSIEPKLKPSALELFAGTDSLRISKKIPVLGRVAAGIPIEANEEIIDYLEISGEMALNGDYFGLVIDGDSMEPRLRKGDIAIVRQQDERP